MSRPFTDMPWYKRCGHPGCKTRMHKNTSTYDVGLCAKHGGLRTGKARDLPVAQPVAAPERPGVRVVKVATMPSRYSESMTATVRVSLPREPWLSVGEAAAILVEKAARK